MAFKQNPHQYTPKQLQDTLDTVKRVSTVKKENKKESVKNKVFTAAAAVVPAALFGRGLYKSYEYQISQKSIKIIYIFVKIKIKYNGR